MGQAKIAGYASSVPVKSGVLPKSNAGIAATVSKWQCCVSLNEKGKVRTGEMCPAQSPTAF
jgi:hypothetical protein